MLFHDHEDEARLHYRDRLETKLIILHDSHTPASMEQKGVDYLLVQGRSRGLLSIGYNFVIERDGVWAETRPFYAMGSHAAGRNHSSIGVCLIGGLGTDGQPEDNFTHQQCVGLKRLLRRINRLYPELPLYGHSEVARFRPGQCCPCGMEDIRTHLLNIGDPP